MPSDVSKDYRDPMLTSDDGTFRVSGWNSEGDASILIESLVKGKTLAPSGITMPKTSGDGIKVDHDAPTFPWRDLEGQYRPDPLGANSPTQAVFRGGLVRCYAYSATDKVDCEYHIPHDWLPGSDLYIHIHWGHNGTTITGNNVMTLAYTYAKGHNQAIFPAEKSQPITFATVDIATTPRYIHRIDEIQLTDATGSGNYLDVRTIEPDGLILVSLTQTTIPTITGGSPDEPFIFCVDLHYQTTNIGTKKRSPDFYA